MLLKYLNSPPPGRRRIEILLIINNIKNMRNLNQLIYSREESCNYSIRKGTAWQNVSQYLPKVAPKMTKNPDDFNICQHVNTKADNTH